MKKHLFLNQSFGTVGSPNQTDETLTRENRIGLKSYLRRTLMLLFAVLMLSISNVGMAWGANTYFTPGETIFIIADGDGAWGSSACVKTAYSTKTSSQSSNVSSYESTTWLWDGSFDGKSGKKCFYTIVPDRGDLQSACLDRYASNCSDHWNWNGGWVKNSSKTSDAHNTFFSSGTGTSNFGWKNATYSLELYGSTNGWASAIGTLVDRGNGVFAYSFIHTATATSYEFKIKDNQGNWHGSNVTLSGLTIDTKYIITATVDLKSGIGSLAMSTGGYATHEPGVYEKAAGSGGYGQSLKTVDGRDYEVYSFSSTASTANYIWAGTTTTTYSDKHCLLQFGTTTEVARGWLSNYVYGRGSSYSNLSATGTEFNGMGASGAYQMNYRENVSKLTLVVSGYDQFAIWGKDNNTTTNHFVVTIDGASQSMTYSNNASGTRRAFDISTGEHIIEISATGTSSNSTLWGFSLRLPASCSAPTSPSISGTTSYTAGDDISLKASATGTSGSTTYTWYKGADWATASASSPVQATSTSGATFTKNSCVAGDAGTYWCNISNGTGCDVQVSQAITVSAGCAASAPGNISKGEASGGTGTITLTSAGSPVSGDTWYWQASASGTSKSESGKTKNVSSAGTYYIRSYNSAGDCWSDAKSVTVDAADLLTPISLSLTYDHSTLVLTSITSATPTLTGNAGSGSVSYVSGTPATATVNGSTGVVSAVAAGTTTITVNVAANGNYAAGSTTATIKVVAAPLGIVDQKLATGSVAWDASDIVTSDYTNITGLSAFAAQGGLSIDGGNGTTSSGTALTAKVEASGGTSKADSKYLEFHFTVAAGKRLHVTAINAVVRSVSNDRVYYATLTGTTGSITKTTTVTEATAAGADIFAGQSYDEYFTGTVSFKLWAYSTSSQTKNLWYRIGSNIYITGTIEDACSTPAAPTNFTAGSISATGATFTITDAADAASYDIYYSTSSTAPTASTPATTTSTSKTKEVTGLTAATTYYAWVRSVCDADHKSAWVALNPDDDTHTFATSCVAPTTVTISATVNEDDGYWFYPGDDVVLTATPTGSPAGSPVTYQWKKNGADIDDATNSTYTINDAAASDAGKYTCTISYGACSTTSAEFSLKCMQFYLKNSSGGDISNHALTKVDATHATLILNLTGGTTYKFRVTDGCNDWYGNTGTMTSSDCTNWTMPDNTDASMTTGLKTANYTFNFDFTAGLLGSEMKVSIVYPGGDQAAGKIIYWDNSVLDWDAGDQWYRIGKSDHHSKTQMTLVPGTANLYKVTTAAYDGFEYWHIANNDGNGTGNLFWTKGDAEHAITNAMAFEGAPVTADAITITPTTSHATGETEDNNNCEFYTYGQTSGMKTDRVTISPYSNGTITVNYTNTSNVASTLTSGSADLAHTVKLTSITATPNTGYDAGAITINGGAYSANYVVTGATTIAATFTPHVYSITYKDQDNVAFSGEHAAGHPTTHTYGSATTLKTASKTGYTFGGWYTSSDCSTGLVTSLGATAYTADITLYAKWTATASLTAISADVLYQAAEMANITFSGEDQNFTGLSTNNLFKVYGTDGNAAKGKNENHNVTDDISTKSFTSALYILSNSNTNSTSDPTEGAIEIITPSTAGLLYLYLDANNSSLTLKKKGTKTSTSLSGATYKAMEVDANTHYFINGSTSGKRGLYGIQYVSTYGVTITPTNVTKATGATGAGAAIKGKAYTATFTANTGNTLPSDVAVTIGGVEQTKGTGYTWEISDGTGTLTVPAAKVTGNIVVSVAGVAAVTHDVTFSLTNVAYSSGDNQGTGAATEGVEFSTIFAASSGYSLPGTITVTIGGVEQTAGTGYTWAQGSGTLTIPAAYVTGDIVVTIVGEEMEGDGCDELVHTEAATATTLSTSVGTATVSNPSSQSANSKAIKLNSSGYIELSPKAGKSFAAGDSLIIVMWNQASSAKTTGYRIAGTDYTASMPSKVNTTFRRKLIAADIVSSKVKIERESGNGSNAYFVSAIIKHCEDLPSCTPPTLPTLSNQTVCPGSDIAAWNAEPTNIATITGASQDVAYSWKKKGSDTELAATASFDLGSSATEGMAGTYVVTVTVSKTGYISKSASAEVDLTVTPATETPSVTASKATVYPGNSVTLTATCGSSGTITWAWYNCNSDGTGESAIGGATSNSYAIASAPAAGNHYYKVKATGDGTNACGTAEYVYTLTVSEASGTCNMMTIFDGSTMSSAPASTSGTESTSGATWTAVGTATEMSSTVSMEYSGKTYTKGWKFTGGATTSSSRYIQIVIPTGYTGDLVMNGFIGSTSRSVFVVTSPTGTLNTSIAYWSPTTTNTLATATTRLSAGTYYVCATNSAFLTELSVNVCGDEVCTDEKPTATATNNTVCSESTLTITATGYESDPTSIQWQKKNGESWDNISGATSATYSVASAAAADAGTYRVQVTKGCTRNSNEVTITVPSAPVFGTVPASVTVMQTIALSISTVEATDAVKYRWYKSADATWDAGDAEICDTKNLLKAYEGEAIGNNAYYVFCRAQNSCGIATSSAIAINVIAFVSEDCAERGGEGEAQFGFDDGGCGQTSYSETACWTTSTRAKYLTYTAPEGKYLKTAKVTVAVSSGSKCGYAYSTDGGTTWTYKELTSLSSTLTEKTIELNSLSSTIDAFRIGRNLQDGSSKDWGVTSGNFYLSKACFEYTESCTATTVTPDETSKTYVMDGGSFTEPTFTIKHGGTAFDPQPTLTYSSSNEDIASVDDDGTVTFNGEAGTVTITAAYAGNATYCASEGSYTINVSCPGGAPKVVADGSTDMVGCNTSVTLHAKQSDGTSDFADGTYQWFRNGEEIDGATSSSYTATQAGTYTVERTNTSDCTTPSTNSAVVTSETTEPEVERLVPFQYYHVDKTYSDQMKMRHLFAVKNSGTKDGKHFKMYVSRDGGAATDVTSSNALVVWPNGDGHVDTVMVDLNKLSGKYSENDELVFTCKAIDCEGNVSDVYKNTITMNVIGATPTLALILNGKDSKVGGDFLEDYEPKNLQEQTGSKAWSGEWPMYTDLKTEYNVTPVNGYAPFNKLNYEPFDIIFLTDFPKASKSDATKTLLDDMYELVDFRPMFSFKTHMLWKSPSKWASKGFTAEPVVPKGGDGRTKMNIVCYAHPMFEAISGSDGTETQRDASDPSQIVYKMLSGVGYENSKGIQGFEIEAAEHFVTIGLIHYNAGSTDGSPSVGQITWSPNAGDRMLVAAAERQANPEARMILLSLNAGAHSKLTAKGRLVVMKSLEYLIQTSGGLIEPADCSYTFDNGEGYSDYNASEYAAAGLHGTKGDGKWSTEANWGPGRNALPGQFTSVRIAAPVTVDMEHAHVMETRIVEGGSIEIPAGKGLEVTSTVRHLDGAEISPTGVSELTLEASTTSNGTLIFNNNTGDSKATVWAYSNGFISEGVKNYQYIGTPFNELNALYNYYGSWIYSWSIKKNGNWGWVAVKNGGPMHAWTGYCISQESPTYYETSGTMTATGMVDIVVPAGENMVIGNSWTAPIDINALTTDDLEGLVANIYFFNTGVDKEGTAGAAGSRYAGGTYVTVPVEAARYEGEDDHINSMQGFFVKNTSGSDGALHLDYDRHVRGTTRGSIIGDALHAPARRAALDSNEPEVLKIKVSGENYDDKLLLLAREDFSTGFDNGWDGDKWDGNESALYIYTTDSEGTENSVSAIPELEGTVIGFRAGEDDAYTLNFEYLNSDEPLYLYDVENNTYTQIMTGMTYRFFTTDNEKHERFIITRSNGQEVATGVEPVSGSLDRSKAKKLLIEDKMFIMVNGMLYDATGKVVK